MNTPDDFSQYYAELLDGIYDCADHIVLNAFCGATTGGSGAQLGYRPHQAIRRRGQLGNSNGGRGWWRAGGPLGDGAEGGGFTVLNAAGEGGGDNGSVS